MRTGLWILGSVLAACGGNVDVLPDSSSGPGGSTSAGAGAGGSGADAGCEEHGGVCVSLDLAKCPDGFVSLEPSPFTCQDPQNTGQSKCCLPGDQLSDTCAAPQPIELVDGMITIEGDTTLAVDEHADLTCESPHVAFTLDQGQLYYRLVMDAGQQYDFELTTSFYGFLYVFPASVGCGFDAIESACSSDGQTGMVSGIVNPGSTGKSFFVPSVTAEHVIAVDGDTSPGPFVLVIRES